MKGREGTKRSRNQNRTKKKKYKLRKILQKEPQSEKKINQKVKDNLFLRNLCYKQI